MPNFPWKKIATTAVAIVGQMYPAIGLAEKTAETLLKQGKTLTAAEKQQLALDFVTHAVEGYEGVVKKDVLNNAAVQEAAREAIDTFVALQNAIVKAGGDHPLADSTIAGPSL